MSRYEMIEDVALLDDVTLPERTRTYTPVGYTELIAMAEDALNLRDFDMTPNKIELAKDGQQMFGTWVVTPQDADDGTEGYQRVLGIRSSYDKSLPCGFVMGVRIMVCSNLQFSGQYKTTRRHTGNILEDLPWDVHKLVSNGLSGYSADIEFLESSKEVMLDRRLGGRPGVRVNDFIVRSMEKNVINSSQIGRVVSEFSSPSFEAFGDHAGSLYNLHNAFTHVIKRVNPMTLVPKTATLTQMVKDEWAEELADVHTN